MLLNELRTRLRPVAYRGICDLTLALTTNYTNRVDWCRSLGSFCFRSNLLKNLLAIAHRRELFCDTHRVGGCSVAKTSCAKTFLGPYASTFAHWALPGTDIIPNAGGARSAVPDWLRLASPKKYLGSGSPPQIRMVPSQPSMPLPAPMPGPEGQLE